jgi:hypothetical protein
MSRKLEIELEKRICEKLIDCLWSDGYALSVYHDGEYLLNDSTDKNLIIDSLFENEADFLIASKKGEPERFIHLVHGNVEDLISDYTAILEPVIKPAIDFAASYSD